MSVFELRVEPGIEAERRDQAIGFITGHFQLIAAPFHRHRNPCRFVGKHINCAIRNTFGALDRLELPLSVLPIPLVAAVDLEQRVTQTCFGQHLSVWRGHYNVEVGVSAVSKRAARESGLHTDHGGIGRDGQRELALNRTSAGFCHAHGDLRFQGTAAAPAHCRVSPEMLLCPMRRCLAGRRVRSALP